MSEQIYNSDENLHELIDPAKYRGFLHVMSHFHSYSRRNIFLIYRQMPHATKLSDFDRWKNDYGRKIKFRAEAIKIMHPVQKTPKTKLVEKIDPRTGDALLDENGKRIMENITLPASVEFEEKKVFDVSQTHGEPLPRIVGDIDDSTREVFWDALRNLYPSYVSKEIMPQDLPTVFQIVANAEEFIAQSVAYVVCHRFGIGGAALPTAETQDVKVFADTLETVRENVHRIITVIENKFSHICRERGIDPMSLPKIMPVEADKEGESEHETTPETSSHSDAKSEPPPQKPPPASPSISPPILAPTLKYMPDKNISITDRNNYGYTNPEILPMTKIRAEAIFKRNIPVYLLHRNNTESMAYYLEEIQVHDGIFGISLSRWQNSREYIALASGDPDARAETRFIYGEGESFAVFQLKENDATVSLRKKTYEQLIAEALSINRYNYRVTYSAPLPPAPSVTPEGIFMWFNAEKPESYSGRDIGTSDVLSIYKGGVITSYYINGRSYRELIDFLGIEVRMNAQAQSPAPMNDAVFNIEKADNGVETVDEPAVEAASEATDNASDEAHAADHEQGNEISDTDDTDKKSPPQDEPPDANKSPPPALPKTPTVVPPIRKEVPVWPITAAEAEAFGRVEDYEVCRKTSIECCEEIDDALRKSRQGKYKFDLHTPAEALVERYGYTRLSWVLGLFILHNKNLFSVVAQQWAKDALYGLNGKNGNPVIPDEPLPFALKTHKTVLEAFAIRVQEVFEKKPAFKARMKEAKRKSIERNNANAAE